MQNYYYSRLSLLEKKAYERIVCAIKNRLTEVKVNMIFSNAEVLNIIKAVRFEHPEFFFVDFNQLRYYKTTLGYIWQIGYLFNDTIQNMIELEIEREATNILCNLKHNGNCCELINARAIHNYLVKNISYDYDALANPGAFPESFSIYGVLCKKKAVCEGVSKAFKYLCDKVGVDCIIVSGTASLESIGQNLSHAWNIVNIQNDYVHIDVTWDIGVSQLCQRNRYDYFCISDSWIGKDHVYTELPQCTSYTYSYFYNKNLLFRNLTEVKKYCVSEFNKKNNVLYFKIIGEKLPKGSTDKNQV